MPAWLWGIAIRRLISRLRRRADFRLGPALLERDGEDISAEERVLLRLEHVGRRRCSRADLARSCGSCCS